LARSRISNGGSGFGNCSNTCVVCMDVPAVLLDLLARDLRRKQLSEERGEIATELPLVQLDRSGRDRRVLLARVEPVCGQLPEGRLLAVVLADPAAAGTPESEFHLGNLLPSGDLRPCLVPALAGVAEWEPLVGPRDTNP
jgi:hypothetical protein